MRNQYSKYNRLIFIGKNTDEATDRLIFSMEYKLRGCRI